MTMVTDEEKRIKELEKALEEKEKEIMKIQDVHQKEMEEMIKYKEDEIRQVQDRFLNEQTKLESIVEAQNTNNSKSNYEKREVVIESWRYDDEIMIYKLLGWEVSKDFQYKNGDHRVSLKRNIADKNYCIWQENSKLFDMIKYMYSPILYLYGTAKYKCVTFKDISSSPKYKLTGIKGVFGIRSKEQKNEIKSKVKEANDAYQKFTEMVKSDSDFIRDMYDLDEAKAFIKSINNKNNVLCTEASRIYEISEKYKITEEALLKIGKEYKCDIFKAGEYMTNWNVTYDFHKKSIIFLHK